MTDVLQRPSAPSGPDGFDDLQWESTSAPASASIATPAAAAILASLVFGAALIHLVMVPSHMNEWTAEGVAFAIVGLVQIALAFAVSQRPTRVALWIGIALNAAFIGAWVWTRTAGSPWGPHAGHAESANFVDIACVVLEGLFVLGALAVLARPSVGRRIGGNHAWAAAIIPVFVVLFATAAIASPSARNHAHDSHGDHAATDGHDHGGAAAHDDGAAHEGGAAAGHDHAAGDDKGLGMLNNGHHGKFTNVELDPLTQARLDSQLAVTREVAAMYPTLADAVQAGYRRQGPYTAGLGIHYGRYNNTNADGTMSREDLLNPMTILYNGTEPTSKIAGFMYYSFSEKEPEGFIGPNDHWHYHTDTCVKYLPNGDIDAPLGADQAVTAKQCAAVGGMLIPKTGWMVHVWTVPGYEVSEADGGVFGEHHPALTCPDGTYYMRPIEEWGDHPLNACKSAP
jgi:hypothetical protein